MNFLKKCNAKNLQDFAQTEGEVELFLHNRYQHVNTDGCLNLRLHRIGRRAVKRLDPKILLDPLEEKLHLPAALVQLCNRQRRQRKVVRQENQSLA